jgi:hypothetical protein
VTSSQPTRLQSELAEKSFSEANLAYLAARAQNRYHDYVLRRFLAAQEEEGLTKAELARRIGKRPELITRLLAAPGNWTFDTVARLLAGIAGEELIPHSERLLGRPQRNHTQPDHLASCAAATQTTPTPIRHNITIRSDIQPRSFSTTANSGTAFELGCQ